MFCYKLLSIFIIHQDLSFGGIALKIEFVVFVYELINYEIVTGFWKTDRNVTLGHSILLAQLMPTLIHHTFALPLSGLVDWSAFLE